LCVCACVLMCVLVCVCVCVCVYCKTGIQIFIEALLIIFPKHIQPKFPRGDAMAARISFLLLCYKLSQT
jgi:hypothetical protein